MFYSHIIHFYVLNNYIVLIILCVQRIHLNQQYTVEFKNAVSQLLSINYF